MENITSQQVIVFTVLGAIMALLVWGRWRYDLVAFAGLLVATIAGVVDKDDAFSGFGHPATVVIAMVLIVSRGLSNAGAIDFVTRAVAGLATNLTRHIFVMSGLAAALSAVMNNVGALALLMPVDLQAAKKAKRSPALTLMPLSFASILGGLVTLIGTPPNIIIAAVRGEEFPAKGAFSMFSFAPVGLACAAAGVAFVALVGWRLIPRGRSAPNDDKGFDLEDYLAEAKVPKESAIIGKKVRELDSDASEYEIDIVGLVRRGTRLPGMARHAEIRAGDLLVIEGGPEDLDRFIKTLGLTHAVAEGSKTKLLTNDDVSLIEVVVPPGARAEGRSTMSLRLKYRFGVHLLGIARQGEKIRGRLRHTQLTKGDVLLLQGNTNELPDVVSWLGCLPLATRALPKLQSGKALTATIIFVTAILMASIGWLYLPVALAAAAVAMVFAGIVPLRDIYTNVDWPVIVLIGSMIPIGQAMENTGATTLISTGILSLSQGSSPVVVLTLLMVVTMTLSDVMNNTATAVVAAPIAINLADRLDVNADPFLMAVAVAASCAFLTPIGHKNNTLILGPGGYRFGDYWRMGLPLEVIVIAVAIPMILWIWPF
ncbi:MAG: SLC13 family permease [Planctomycetota bacterium]